MHYTNPPIRNPAVAPTRCTTFACEDGNNHDNNNIIAIQRELLAQKHKLNKMSLIQNSNSSSQMASPPPPPPLCSSSALSGRYPLQEISEEQQGRTSSTSNNNDSNNLGNDVVPYSYCSSYTPDKSPLYSRQLIVMNSRPRLQAPVTFDESSCVEVVHVQQQQQDEEEEEDGGEGKSSTSENKNYNRSRRDSRDSASTTSTTTTSTTTTGTDSDEHSLSTATLTTTTTHPHGASSPLYLPGTFKPAYGCIMAPEFLIRCFVARLRKGVTVIKHGRSRFQRSSRLYILQLLVVEKNPKDKHNNGNGINIDIETTQFFLTWKPAGSSKRCATTTTTIACSSSSNTEATNNNHSNSNNSNSNQRQRVDMMACQEVRMAQTPDPNNPRFTGSAILREKCNAADAHKSFALIFPHRTLDITARTADQCKMLTEGFSALCYRMHVGQQHKAAAAAQNRRGPRRQDPSALYHQQQQQRKSCLRVI